MEIEELEKRIKIIEDKIEVIEDWRRNAHFKEHLGIQTLINSIQIDKMFKTDINKRLF